MTGTDDPDPHIGMKKVDLWNDELHELFLVRVEKQRNKVDIDPLTKKETH